MKSQDSTIHFQTWQGSHDKIRTQWAHKKHLISPFPGLGRQCTLDCIDWGRLTCPVDLVIYVRSGWRAKYLCQDTDCGQIWSWYQQLNSHWPNFTCLGQMSKCNRHKYWFYWPSLAHYKSTLSKVLFRSGKSTKLPINAEYFKCQAILETVSYLGTNWFLCPCAVTDWSLYFCVVM